MDSTNIVEIFFSILPTVGLGILFLKLSSNFKKKYKQKLDTATKATVVNVVVVETRTTDNYFKKNVYILSLSYYYNGTSVVRDYRSVYDYKIDSIVDIEVVNGEVISILSDPPRDVMDDFKSLNLKGNQILFFIGVFLLGFSALSLIVGIVDILGEKYKFIECLALVVILLYIYLLINKKKDKNKLKISLIKNGGYSPISAKIVDIKKISKYKDGVHISYFYPIIEYYDGYDFKRKIIYNNMGNDVNVINQNMLIYMEKSTGVIVTENDLKFLELSIKVLTILNIFLLILVVFCIISYL